MLFLMDGIDNMDIIFQKKFSILGDLKDIYSRIST